MANEFLKTTINDRQQRENLAVLQNSPREMVDNMDYLTQSLKIFLKWDVIVANLTKPNMSTSSLHDPKVDFTNQSGIMWDISFDSDQLDHYVAKYNSLLEQYAASQ